MTGPEGGGEEDWRLSGSSSSDSGTSSIEQSSGSATTSGDSTPRKRFGGRRVGGLLVGCRNVNQLMASVTSNRKHESGQTAAPHLASFVLDVDNDTGGMRGRTSTVPESLVIARCPEGRARGTTGEPCKRGVGTNSERIGTLHMSRELKNQCSQIREALLDAVDAAEQEFGKWQPYGRGWRREAKTRT